MVTGTDMLISEQDSLLKHLQANELTLAFQQARRLTQIYPKHILGWKVLGTLLVHQGDYETAQLVLECAQRLDTNDAEILNNLGQVYQNLKQFPKALVVYREAAKLSPDIAEIWYNQGLILQKLGHWDYAFKSYKKAIQLKPEYAKAYNNLGDLLRRLGYIDEALNTYEKLLTFYPNDAPTLNNIGALLQSQGYLEKALLVLQKSLSIEPKFVVSIVNYANVLMDQGCLEQALENYEKALSIQPNLVVARQNRLMCLNYSSDYPSDWIIAEHRAFGRLIESQITTLPPDQTRDRNPERRLRLGFVSGDFRLHSVAFFLLPVLENLDQQKFEVFCYSTCPTQDEWTKRFQAIAKGWIEATILESSELAERIHADAIDLLFDLAGYTAGNVLSVFAAKPAPIQISWIGYPNTTGLTTIDYRLVDPITDPPHLADNGYSEKLVRLPHSFLCYRPFISPKTPNVSKAPCLEKQYITFGSFNNLAKLNSTTLNLWIAILHAVPNSHLRLKSGFVADLSTWERLVQYFIEHGIAQERLEVQLRVQDYNEHLATYSHVDIVLDSFPYHGTTTTCESLFMGVPVITLAGDRHAARVGISLLTQVGLSEFIANSANDYIHIAVELASNQSFLNQLRTELREKLERSSLRDEVTFTRSFELALRKMWNLWCTNKSPQEFKFESSEIHRQQEKIDSSKILKNKKTTKYKSENLSKLKNLTHKKEQQFLSNDQQKVVNLFTNENYNKALDYARQLVKAYPENAFNLKILGTILAKMDFFEEAIPSLLESIRIKPEADSLNSLGFALMMLGRLKEAKICYERALEIDSEYAHAHSNLGVVYSELGYLDLALECAEKALAIDPNYADAYANRSCIFGEMGLLKEAEVNCQRALDLNPNSAICYNNLGKIKMVFGDFYAAHESYQKALTIKPDLVGSFNNMLFCLNYQDNLSAQKIFEAHCSFQTKQASQIKLIEPLKYKSSDANKKLRLGFVSGDFKFHSVAFFLFPFLENLNHQKFEIFCYSLSHRQDEATIFFRNLANCWLDCQGLSASAFAERIRADNIDLLFDLSGHTSPNALLTFAARPAPIQINWIGYPNTTGLSAMDYRLVDDLTDPLGETDRFHTEKLIRLPTGFLCYRPWKTAFLLPVTRLPYLRNNYITFGSFNNFCKITPATLNLWIKILNSVPNSKLLLKSHTSSDTQIWDQVAKQFEKAGISSKRLSFLGRAPSYDEHLMQYESIDIALDTYPYNGTTTTCEALFMGVPVITLAGDRHVARVGKSLMTRVGLKDFIAYSSEEYVSIAMRWGADPNPLAELRAGLRDHLEHSSLRDEAGFTRSLENTLHQMWQLWCLGESPKVFEVELATRQ